MTLPAFDTAPQFVFRVVLSTVLLRAAVHKLRDLSGFRSTLANYRLLPKIWVTPVSVLLVLAEAGVAVGLWWAGTFAILAAGLFLIYGGAILVNLLRGRRDVDCGCAGPAARQKLGAGLVVRNAVLVVVAASLLLPAMSRPLLWVDFVTIIGGGGALVLLYLAAEGLLAHTSRLQIGPGLVQEQETARA